MDLVRSSSEDESSGETSEFVEMQDAIARSLQDNIV